MNTIKKYICLPVPAERGALGGDAGRVGGELQRRLAARAEEVRGGLLECEDSAVTCACKY